MPNPFEPGNEHQEKSPESFEHARGPEEQRKELLESMLESTKHSLEDRGMFPALVNFVRAERLPSKFSYDNLCELVRYILDRTNLNQILVDIEECVNWIASCIYEDPIGQQRSQELWAAIVNQIQNEK